MRCHITTVLIIGLVLTAASNAPGPSPIFAGFPGLEQLTETSEQVAVAMFTVGPSERWRRDMGNEDYPWVGVMGYFCFDYEVEILRVISGDIVKEGDQCVIGIRFSAFLEPMLLKSKLHTTTGVGFIRDIREWFSSSAVSSAGSHISPLCSRAGTSGCIHSKPCGITFPIGPGHRFVSRPRCVTRGGDQNDH